MSAPAKATTSQPEATQMNVMNVAKPAAKDGAACKHGQQCEHEHKQTFMSRLRGGGAGKDCLLGMSHAFMQSLKLANCMELLFRHARLLPLLRVLRGPFAQCPVSLHCY
ncbi:hypothetical protein K438DRAFT_1800637 [Mycena galopus ATCC 62051]|nr:hypothetical protein K438DRAFT_1800637 [Mycena galopus ATCC 62051]